MMNRIVFGLMAIMFLFAVNPVPLHAQENNFKVTIARPGEGEILYTGPGAPYVCAPVTGWVTTDQIDVTQVQVKLELYQGAHRVGSLLTQPTKDGKYSFDVAINDNNPDDHPVSECALSMCHIFSSLGFPAGRVLVRVTATDLLGHQAVAERSIIVDHSGSVNVPVEVVVEGASNVLPQGINISAVTRLYGWRARQYIIGTDANGRALFNIEALGQASTRYFFRLDPIVVDEVQYSSREYAQLTLPPGASTAEPVKLLVQAVRGRIAATVTAQNRAHQIPLTVRAIELQSGAVQSAKTVNGKVTLSNLPISKYLLRVDDEEAASQGLQSEPRMIDLNASPITSTTLPLTAAPTQIIRGIVHDSDGKTLPLVWLVPDVQGKSIRVAPSSGEFVAAGFSNEVHSLWVVAPGYWRRLVALDSERLDIELTREPDTRNIPWGTGIITLPPETLATLTDNHISLRRGWVWGKGTGAFTITTPDVEIELQAGTFALESLLDAPSWLYLIDGQAQVTVLDTNAKIMLMAGQMIAFGYGVNRPIPVALDSHAVRALYTGETLPVRIETESSPLARMRDGVARTGISLGRMLFLVGLILGITLILWVKRRGVRFEKD